MDEAKLKHCPFCGGKPVIYKSVLNRMVWVVCSECSATSLSSFSEETVIEAWNRRVKDD